MGPDSKASACPFGGREGQTRAGCPVSPQARDFDAFEGPFLTDPAEALRWAREAEPVFFSEKLGYWVVSRYDDVKAVFRDNITFSPCNALERITPFSAEAEAVLKRYNYGMSRTLVNEDEPAHMPRRRVLMKSFEPAELAHHQTLVKKLTRQCVDRFIDQGQVDLVQEMLWEIPLTVALHFLGVSDEDVDTLRKYTVALTKTTWGRPSPEEQVAVADSVGKFWVLAGEVLDRIKANPSGNGWMEYAVRQNKAYPDIVTDSYLHSIMMAIILAAHETTTLASSNMMALLLQDRQTWEDICANPALIPNAVEECLRFAGSVKAWRRQTTVDTEIAGTPIPAGAKLLIVTASANHDERQFEAADRFDIYRDNTSAHLTFGYGSHQCMGKNLARMEMCTFLEELTRRLPHMEMAPDQTLTYQPSISFRGPEHLYVRWNPEQNPERTAPELRTRDISFPIGAPAKGSVARLLRVTDIRREADEVVGLTLEDPHGRPLSLWAPGAHIDIEVAGHARKYSLCGDPENHHRYDIAVLRDQNSRGGSAYIHDTLKIGDKILVRSPKNHFRLREEANRYLLVAGGIGITPIVAMADRLKAAGKDYTIHYIGRRQPGMAFIDRLRRGHAGRLELHLTSERGRPDLKEMLGAVTEGAEVYACGPDGLLQEIQDIVPAEFLKFEYFSNSTQSIIPEHEQSFEVELEDSGLTINVPPDQTLLEVLRARGIDVPSDCEEGLCGSCEVRVVNGDIDHRDKVLTAPEREENRRMMACCSRGRGKKLVLAL